MEVAVRVRGSGRVELAAHGIADAEHRVEKELGRCWPGARVTVLEAARRGGGAIVEEFSLAYRVEGVLRVEAASPAEAAAPAFRLARQMVAGTRYQRTAFEMLNAR